MLTKVEKLQQIIELNTLMNKIHDFNKLLNLILVQTEKLFSVDGTAIFLEDEETGTLFFYIATGEKKDILKTIKMKKDEGVCGYVFTTGVSLIENSPEKSKIFSNKADKKTNFITRNILAVPLEINQKRIGVIELVNKYNYYDENGNIITKDIENNSNKLTKKYIDFNEDDKQFLHAIATQVSLTLERQRIFEEKIRDERLVSMGETVSGLAHYIKNILNGLKGGAFIIDKNLDKIDNPSVKTGWDMVKRNIDRVSKLTMDMLRYVKDREPEYEKVKIHNILDEVIELEYDRAKKNNIELIKNYSPDIDFVEVDPNGIHRCVLNLVSNAIDALNGVENPKITIKTHKLSNEKFIIQVSDNGVGMPEEIQKKLFTKFMSTKGSKGTGLGLKITKKIIEEHGGNIYVYSKENEGTTFTIKLPINKPKKESKMAKKIILAIDDEMDSIEFIRSVVEDENIDFYYANDGDEGLEKAKSINPDLIILDVQMPRQDGFVTFWELRKDEKTKHIPVVFLTGIRQTLGARFSKEVVGDLVGEEPDYYVEKPINPDKLQKIVKEVLG